MDFKFSSFFRIENAISYSISYHFGIFQDFLLREGKIKNKNKKRKPLLTTSFWVFNFGISIIFRILDIAQKRPKTNFKTKRKHTMLQLCKPKTWNGWCNQKKKSINAAAADYWSSTWSWCQMLSNEILIFCEFSLFTSW